MCMYTNVCKCMYDCIHLHAHICRYTYPHIRMYTYIYIYSYLWVYASPYSHLPYIRKVWVPSRFTEALSLSTFVGRISTPTTLVGSMQNAKNDRFPSTHG